MLHRIDDRQTVTPSDKPDVFHLVILDSDHRFAVHDTMQIRLTHKTETIFLSDIPAHKRTPRAPNNINHITRLRRRRPDTKVPVLCPEESPILVFQLKGAREEVFALDMRRRLPARTIVVPDVQILSSARDQGQ